MFFKLFLPKKFKFSICLINNIYKLKVEVSTGLPPPHKLKQQDKIEIIIKTSGNHVFLLLVGVL